MSFHPLREIIEIVLELTMSFHPLGEIIEIVGINSNTNGHSCEEHHTCGCVLEEDTLVRLRKHQVYINGCEQSTVGVYWVSDGVDRCLVRYLHRHQVKHLNKLEGALCQVTEVYSDNSDSPMKQHKHKKNFGCVTEICPSRRVGHFRAPC